MSNLQPVRIREIDAARGAAMAAVCVSHSALFLNEHPQQQQILVTLGMVATPTFLLLSGTVCGHLATTARETVEEFRRRLVDRGLFLLLVAHLVLGLTNAAWAPLSDALLGSVYIPDAVGVGLIVAAFIARRLSARTLFLYGVAVFSAACFTSMFMQAKTDAAGDVVRFLARPLLGVGGGDWNQGGYMVPLAPYLGIFLIGLAGGLEYSARRRQGASLLDMACVSIRIGLVCMAAAVCIKVLALWVKPHLSAEVYQYLYFLTDPRQKIPPGIGYLLAFGGAGVFGLGIILALSHVARGQRLIATLAVVGRASLITFVAQFWVYAFPARALHVGDLGQWWFAAFAASVTFLWLVAAVWDRGKYNRFLTLGLRRKGGRVGVEAPT